MNQDFLKDLNSRQREAVISTEGRVRVTAGAGTGKTRALTYRYAYLVNVLGIDPANILCLTFTNKAAAQMRRRISTMVQSGDYNDFVCTIHGFCVKFLRKEIYRLGFPKSFPILDDEDRKNAAKSAMDELGIKRTKQTVKKFLAQISEFKALDDYIPALMLPGAELTDEMRKSQFAAYISRQMKFSALDFDDLVNFTKYILDRFEDAREFWQNELNYIMVDEAQDCNADDWEIIEKLAAKHKNLFVVGDPDQAIYEWRGAKPERFVNFSCQKEVILDQNYRSTPQILDVANSIIANNINRIPKTLFTFNKEGRIVTHYHAKSEKDETEWLVGQIGMMLEKGGQPDDFAVLFRSSYLSQSVEEELLKNHIPYTVWGGVRFFERREIKDALSYLRLIDNPEDDLSFLRIANVPPRRIGRAFTEKLKTTAMKEGLSLYQTLKRYITDPVFSKSGAPAFIALIEKFRSASRESSVSDVMNNLLDESGLKTLYREDQDEDRLDNIDALLQSMKYYEEDHKEVTFSLSDYLQDISLYTNADYPRDTPTVKLMTIHQAKGLEFKCVFVIGLSEGVFPNMRTIRDFKKNGEEEERRLMYVAVTRAERNLFLTESEGFSTSTKMNKCPSRFLHEIGRSMFVTIGTMSKELWDSTLRVSHVLDEDETDGFASERGEYESRFSIGDAVTHEVFGEGEIVSANKELTSFQVRFSDGSLRQIRASFLKPQDLPD